VKVFSLPGKLCLNKAPPPPRFNSHENGINHVTTLSYHPASNGLAERFLPTFKETILKEQGSKQTDKFMALKNVIWSSLWSPHTSTGLSPANMMRPSMSIQPQQKNKVYYWRFSLGIELSTQQPTKMAVGNHYNTSGFNSLWN